MAKWRQAVLVVLIMVAATSGVTAGRHNAASGRNSAASPAGDISEQRAIAIAQQHFKGRVLAISQSDQLYRIKILSERDTVHMVLINAVDGSVVSAR